MTLTHYSLTNSGVEFELDDVPYSVSATDALHLMHLILQDQIALQFMLLEAQYPATLGADRARAEAVAAQMIPSRPAVRESAATQQRCRLEREEKGGNHHVQSH